MRHYRLGFWEGVSSFVEGLGQSMDLFGATHRTPEEILDDLGIEKDDSAALRSDFEAVIGDWSKWRKPKDDNSST